MKLDEFTEANAPKTGDDGFQKEIKRLLDIVLDGTAMFKPGLIIGETGEMTFTGQSSAEGGLTGFVKDAIADEGTPVMKAEGSEHLYVPTVKKVQILDLDGDESISVNSNDTLAGCDTRDHLFTP